MRLWLREVWTYRFAHVIPRFEILKLPGSGFEQHPNLLLAGEVRSLSCGKRE